MVTDLKTATAVVKIDRSFKAQVDALWGAFTDPEAVARWGVGNTYDNLAIDIDPRVGGVTYQRVRAKDDGAIWTFFGVYQEVEPKKKLTYSFDWKTDWREDPSPNLVTITFHDHGDSSEIRIEHSQLVEEAIPSTESHWNEFLDTLAEHLEKA